MRKKNDKKMRKRQMRMENIKLSQPSSHIRLKCKFTFYLIFLQKNVFLTKTGLFVDIIIIEINCTFESLQLRIKNIDAFLINNCVKQFVEESGLKGRKKKACFESN